MSKTNLKKSAGFTLLEILLVVGIIAILAGIVILAINPTKQLGDARNAQRRSDVMTILSAIYQYSIDNAGDLSDIAGEDTTIATSTDCDANTIETDAIELTALTDNDLYLVDIPSDPTNGTDTASGYFVVKNGTTERITVCAPGSVGEGSVDGDTVPMISVTR
jgi:prepilin-type N-terminal cleavage/methylation domain-containing protein